MILSKYLKMNFDELGKEIEKQNKKIKSAQETIKLLRKLQVAESSSSEKRKSESTNPPPNQITEKRFYKDQY